MAIRKKIPDPKNVGQEVWATSLDIVEMSEPFSRIKLEDGTIITMRSVVNEVFVIEDRFDAQGNPEYTVNSQLIANITPPDSTRDD